MLLIWKIFIKVFAQFQRSEDYSSCSSSDVDELAYVKDRAVKDRENHEWKKHNNNKNIPGTPMIVVKVDSPDEIVLKYADKDPSKYVNTFMK